MRFIFALLTVLIAVVPAQAQKNIRPDYKLLWKISGKGLTKPSYLFGTMHVTDERAFDFSDSVLVKLDQCEAFALEVHPDSVMQYAFSKMMDSEGTRIPLDKLLTAAEYKELDSLLKLHIGQGLDDFSTPTEIRQHLINKVQNNDRKVFLDAWLYDIAARQNKIILGLEKFSTQVELLDSNPKSQLEQIRDALKSDMPNLKDSFTDMIDVYHSGNLDSIHNLSLRGSVADYDDMITNRNLLMLASIKQAIHKHSTFIAVGAAHLPGDEGLVYLLQKAGYKVTLVQPVFTGLAKKYKFTPTERQWEDMTSVDGGYVISFPGNTMPFKPKSVPITFNAYMDIGGQRIFMAAHVPLDPSLRSKSASTTFDFMEAGMKKKFQLTDSRNTKIGGLPARELQLKSGNQSFIVTLVLRDYLLYMLMAGPSKEAIQSADTKKFMASLRPIALPPVVGQNFVNKKGAFSANMAGNVMEQALTPADPETGKLHKINLFMASNPESGEAFIVRYNDMIPGFVPFNDSVHCAQILASVMEASHGENLKQEKITVEGFDAVQFTFDIRTGSAKAKGFLLLRGSRFYACLTVRTSETSPDAGEAFLNSFKLVPYQQSKTKLVSLPDGISLRVPESFESDSAMSTRGDVKQYSWLDGQTGIAYAIQVESLNSYAEAKSAGEYFKSLGERLVDRNDSLVTNEPVQVGKLAGHEFWFKSNVINSKKRVRYVVAGNLVVSFWAYLPIDYEQSTITQEAFDSFAVTPQSGWNLFDDKTDLILRDIFSADSTVNEEATSALPVHDFETSDLPKLYKAIEHSLAKSDNVQLSNRLLSILNKMHDATTSEFIEKLYPLLPDSTELRDNALGVLASLKTASDTERMIKLLSADKTDHIFSAYEFLVDYYDSLELIAPWMPTLLKSYPRLKWANSIFYQIQTCLDSGLFDAGTRESVVRYIVELANEFVPQGQPNSDEDDYYEKHSRLVALAELLATLKFSPEMKTLILQFHNLSDAEIRIITAKYLLKNGVKVSADDIELIAKNPVYRFSLYEELLEINQQRLINKKYLTPVMMAESDLYEYLAEDDGTPDKVTLVTKKQVLYENKKQTLFVFKYLFEYDGEEEWATAIAGPYDTAKGSAMERGILTYSLYGLVEGKELNERLSEIAKENNMKLLD